MENKMLYKLKNGKLITPPEAGKRATGETVVGYKNLSKDKLKEDGWKELISNEFEIQEDYKYIPFYEEDESAIYLKHKKEPIDNQKILLQELFNKRANIIQWLSDNNYKAIHNQNGIGGWQNGDEKYEAYKAEYHIKKAELNVINSQIEEITGEDPDN